MVKANPHAKLMFYMLAFLSLFVATQSFAMDASPAMTGLPGEASMTKFVRFIFGPLAYMMISIGVVVVGLNSLGAIDVGKGLWGAAALVIFGGLLVFSQQFLTTLFSGAAIPEAGIPVQDIIFAMEGMKK